ncbi:MAG: ATP-dependent DNA helicase RecG [Acidobacteriota bacterium]
MEAGEAIVTQGRATPAVHLSRSLVSLPGIGPVRLRRFHEEGFRTVEDFLTRPPVRYEDRSRCPSLKSFQALPAGRKATVRVRVVRAWILRGFRRRITIIRATVTDGETCCGVAWFNQPYLYRQLRAGREMFLYGAWQPSRGRGRPAQIENPRVEFVGTGDNADQNIHTGRITPVYRRLAELSPRRLRRLVHAALTALPDSIPDPIPAPVLQRQRLPPRGTALRELHFPPAGTSLDRLAAAGSPPQRRMIFEELFLLATAMKLKRIERRRTPRYVTYANPDPLALRPGAIFPFELTADQRRALNLIGRDLASPFPMARLLQGDVGCGKTVVAVLSMLVAATSGAQAALMAPTEILAVQHHRRLRGLLERAGCRLEILTGGTVARACGRVRKGLATGEVRLVVGTHALFQEGVSFRCLAMVVIDEQHRFGVAQGERLIEKGRRPDVLVMTATPIPRSLALTAYGDLDRVEIRETPPGRRSVATLVMPDTGRSRVWECVRRQVKAGRQALVICPRIRSGGSDRCAGALETWQRLSSGPLARVDVGLVHGGLDPGRREEVMQAFERGTIRVLVATTVIEVGVDVPDATVLVVVHADQFGLAQLHQLRGRVGRAGRRSVCILLHGRKISPEASQRLAILARTADGFAIASQDLALRGPGDLPGLRQHGRPGFRLADLVRDEALLEAAFAEAARLPEKNIHGRLREAALSRWSPGQSPGGGIKSQRTI